MDKSELQKQQKYYLQQILLTVCGGQINLDSYKFNRVFIVCGFTGSGKDTLIDHAVAKSKVPLSKFVRTLTRDGRPGEMPANDAFFVKPDFFDYLKTNKKFFYHYEKYDGDHFGYNIMHLIFLISRSHVVMVGGGEQHLEGLVEGVHNIFPDAPVTSIFVNRPKELIISGLKARGGDPAEIAKRIAFIENNWRPQPERHFDYVIWNETLKKAQSDFLRAIANSTASSK